MHYSDRTLNRRTFVKTLGAAGVGLAAGSLLPAWAATAAPKPPPTGQVQLPGNKIAQFVDKLPVLDLTASGTKGIDVILAGAAEIVLRMRTFQVNTMPTGFVPANGLPYTGTWTFGYVNGAAVPTGPRATAVGPAIVATRGVPTQIRYVNNLTADATTIHWRDWTDQSLHSAFHQAVGVPMPTTGNAAHYTGPVLAVPHLHGGEDPAVIDGGPEAWFASDEPGTTPISVTHGPAYYSKSGAAANEALYRYPNTQEAGPLWFHDHLLGGTRLNATYSGLAGAYLVTDPALILPTGLTAVGLGGDLLVPLVIQDRMFDTDGQLFFPNVGINPEHPYWVPEFVGDTIVVNGKVWPYLDVVQKRYRFFLINGSNSRPYDMFIQDITTGVKGPPMYVISTDGGYLDSAVKIDPNATGQQVMAGVQKSLLMMPGERYEMIVDFGDPAWLASISAAYAARGIAVPNPLNLLLRNTAPTVNGNPKASLDGRIMQFRVAAGAVADASYNPATVAAIRAAGQKIVRLADPVAGTLAAGVTANKTRELTLAEVAGPGGPLEVLVNNTKWMGMRPDGAPIPGSTFVSPNYLTELPTEGQTEVWEIVNTTMDKHPIHLHGLQFQIMNRQPFNAKAWAVAYAAAFPGSATIVDPMTGLPYAAGVYIPSFGPPLPYSPTDAGYNAALQGGKYGGNPDITPYLLGAAAPPLNYEQGWKDTAIMNPGEVTRIAVRFAPQDKAINAANLYWTYQPDAPVTAGQPGVYVWHCHITDHEDNEMMRPDEFLPNPAAVRTYIKGVDY